MGHSSKQGNSQTQRFQARSGDQLDQTCVSNTLGTLQGNLYLRPHVHFRRLF
jgi:hypothetical protein